MLSVGKYIVFLLLYYFILHLQSKPASLKQHM